MMLLKKDITVTSSTGYAVWMSEAAVDIKKNKIVSDSAVEVKLSNGTDQRQPARGEREWRR